MPRIPDWQLPEGVDRGLWDYLHATEMVATYDAQMQASVLAAKDIQYCQKWFKTPGKIIDLGCGTGRVASHFVPQGYQYTGVDLSKEMLKKAKENFKSTNAEWKITNLVSLEGIEDASFDYAACLFSTWGMIRGEKQRQKALLAFARVTKPGGLLVLHAHCRWFRELGWKRFWTRDFTMPQAYGGAPLTLHHFSQPEIEDALEETGWKVQEVQGIDLNGNPAQGWGRVYGFLTAAIRV